MGSLEEADLVVKRYLYVYPTEEDFKRFVVKVESKESETGFELMSHIFLQYYFEYGVKEIIVPPHGNCRNGTPYLRTKERRELRRELRRESRVRCLEEEER